MTQTLFNYSVFALMAVSLVYNIIVRKNPWLVFTLLFIVLMWGELFFAYNRGQLYFTAIITLMVARRMYINFSDRERD